MQSGSSSRPHIVEALAEFLRDDPSLKLPVPQRNLSAVDYIEYFEVIYHLTSFELGQSQCIVIKTRLVR